MRRTGIARFCWLLAALLQLVLPGAAAWVDARVEQESRSPRAASHVESHQTSQCPRVHPPDCALCQYLTAPLARVAAQRFELPPLRRHGVVVDEADRAAPAAAFALHQSRAPPLA